MKSFASILVLSLLVPMVSFAKANPCTDVANSIAEYEQSKMKTFVGCKLEYIEPGSLYGELGMKAGDIVTPPTDVKADVKVKAKAAPAIEEVPGLEDLELKNTEFQSAEIGIED